MRSTFRGICPPPPSCTLPGVCAAVRHTAVKSSVKPNTHTHDTFSWNMHADIQKHTHTHGRPLTLQSHMIYFHSLVFTHEHTDTHTLSSTPPRLPVRPAASVSPVELPHTHLSARARQTQRVSVRQVPNATEGQPLLPDATGHSERDDRLVLDAAGTTSRHSQTTKWSSDRQRRQKTSHMTD